VAINAEERGRISLKIDRNKHAIYRDYDCIAQLEDFLANAVSLLNESSSRSRGP
jgi:hypothetical protein